MIPKFQKKGSLILKIIVPVCLIFVLLFAAPQSQVLIASEVEITYTGNEGFLIVAEGKKILIDTFHRKGSVKTQRLLENGRPPFDNVDLILTTHTHHDHFDLHMVKNYMENNPVSIFISTKEAIAFFERYFESFEKIETRLKGFDPKEGDKMHFSHDGIEITIMHLHHGRNRSVKITNLGFLFSFGGKKFLHMGDSEAILPEILVYDLPKEKIDVAFVPYWYFSNKEYQPALHKGIGAKHVIPMHLILLDGGQRRRELILKSIQNEFPDAITFTKEMEKKVIQ